MRLFAGAVAATLMIATPVHALTLIVTVNKSDYESPIIIDVNSTNSEIKKLPSSTSPDTILYNVSSNLEIFFLIQAKILVFFFSRETNNTDCIYVIVQ